MEPKPTNSNAEQEGFDFQPQHDQHAGIRFTFSGGLMIPAPGESERIAKERGPEMASVVGSKPVLHVVESLVIQPGRYRGQTVKIRGKDALKLTRKA